MLYLCWFKEVWQLVGFLFKKIWIWLFCDLKLAKNLSGFSVLSLVCCFRLKICKNQNFFLRKTMNFDVFSLTKSKYFLCYLLADKRDFFKLVLFFFTPHKKKMPPQNPFKTGQEKTIFFPTSYAIPSDREGTSESDQEKKEKKNLLKGQTWIPS